MFTLCHDQEAFPARYRLYQTATPRVFDASNAKVARLDRTKWIVASMSDASIFGPVAYRLPYKEAVEKRFLSDYRIIAIGVDERAWTAANRIVQQFEQSQESRGLTTREALSWLVYGVTLAGGAVGDDGRLRVSRSLAFLNKVQRSGQMVKWLTSDEGRSAERFVRSIKEECLHRVVPLGEGHLRLIVHEYVEHYHRERNHQGLDNQLLQRPPPPVRADADVQRRERLGGLLSFYYREAA